MSLLEQWMPDLEPDLVSCPVPIIERRLRESAIEACEDANVWAIMLDEIPTVAQQTSYVFQVPENTQVHSVLSVMHNSRPLSLDDREVYVNERGGIELNNRPKYDSDPIEQEGRRRAGLDVTVTMKPTRDATELADILFSDYHKMIIAGTLAKAFAMKNRRWSEPEEAARHRVIFEEEIADAKRAVDRGFITGSQRLERRQFASSTQYRGTIYGRNYRGLGY